MKPTFIAAILAVAISSSARAAEFIAKVSDVTAEGMPSYVAFQLSSSPCPGYFAYSSSDRQRNKAVYVMLLEAAASSGSVWVQYDSACVATAVHGVQVPDEEKRDTRRVLRRAARKVVELLIVGL